MSEPEQKDQAGVPKMDIDASDVVWLEALRSRMPSSIGSNTDQSLAKRLEDLPGVRFGNFNAAC